MSITPLTEESDITASAQFYRHNKISISHGACEPQGIFPRENAKEKRK